jgi:hypothetical protein
MCCFSFCSGLLLLLLLPPPAAAKTSHGPALVESLLLLPLQ